MLTGNKLNNIETLLSQALIEVKTTHKEFAINVGEKQKYEQMKENIKSNDEKDELSENSKNNRENSENV